MGTEKITSGEAVRGVQNHAAPLDVRGTRRVSVRDRLDAVDQLRGLVMAAMVLDHVRDYFYYNPFDPTDLDKTSVPLFLTRWVTHFCAPIFVFLAGTGAFLYGARGKTRTDLSLFLLTRGLWLVLLELTWVRFGFSFNLDYHFVFGAVIWAIGWSMVVLAGLVYLPVGVVAFLGVAILVCHNLFDPLRSGALGPYGWAWSILHTVEPVEYLPGWRFLPAYPLLPWIGVLCAGYGFGTLLLDPRPQRRRNVAFLGLLLTVAFFALRYRNDYGDPQPWGVQKDPTFTALSFLNCRKYPPSLLYVLMTLGPGLLLLAWMDRPPGWLGRRLIVLGRVPLFFYLLHLPLIHGGAVLVALLRFGPDVFKWNPASGSPPAEWFFNLPTTYVISLAVVVILYFPCAWFAGVKERHRSAWLSYL